MLLFNTAAKDRPLTVSAQNLSHLKDLFHSPDRAAFKEKAVRYALTPEHEADLLHYICAHKPAQNNSLSVLFEAVLCGQTMRATRVRHFNHHHANAAINASLAVDAVLARKDFDPQKLPAGSLLAAHDRAYNQGYDWAVQALAAHLPPPRAQGGFKLRM